MAHRLVSFAINHHDVLNVLNGLSFHLSCTRLLARDEALHQTTTFLVRPRALSSTLLLQSVVPVPSVLLPLECSTRGSLSS